jgi:hypothetical protein
MKKKGKQFRQSYSYKKLYLDDLKNIVDIFDEKLISHNISDENVEYDNFEEFISFNKDNKQVKKLYFNGHKNINVPAQHVKSEIEFKLELSKYNGAVITCDDEENTKEIRLLLEDVLERNRMWLFYILSFIVVLVNIFLIVFVISIILAFANIQFIKGVIDPITHEYGAYGYLFLLW